MNALGLTIGMGMLATSAMAGGLDGSGLVVLDQSADGALTMVGNSVVQVPARAVYVNSNSSTAIRTTGSATLDAPNLYVVGSASFGGRSGCTGTVHQSCVPYADPLQGLRFPSASGAPDLGSLSISGGASRTLSPGYYSHGISVTGNAQVTLSPGVYLIGGSGLRITSGAIAGDGVTLVMLAGSLNIAGTSSLQLSPPSSGDLDGVVIAQPSANHSELGLAGGSGVVVTGAIYAPGATVNLVGNSTLTNEGPQFGDAVVANRVSLAGTGAIKIGRPEMRAIVLPQLPLAD